MIAFKQLMFGLTIAHMAWAYFFLCGSLITGRPAPRSGEGPRDSAASLLRIVLTSTAGMAITGFVTFLAGLFHALYPLAFVVWILAATAILVWRKDSPFEKSFWVARADLWRRAVSLPAVVVYAVALAISIPAYIPDTGSDATAYHLPYAFDWASAHIIYADQWLRFPHYANNWALIDAWMISFGLTNLIAFLSWLAAALLLLGVYSAVVLLSAREGLRSSWALLTGIFAATGLALNPTFFKIANTAMLDAPIALLFFAGIASVAFAILYKRPRYLWLSCVCLGFFAGTKASFIFFVPLFVAIVWYAANYLRLSRRSVFLLVLSVVCLSAPWYVRNLVAAGDPIAPTLNLALHGVDSKWSKADMVDLMGDLKSDSSLRTLVSLPATMYSNPGSREVRTPGVTLLAFALFFPGIVLAWFVLRRRIALADPAVVVGSIVLVYTMAYWNGTSHYARYAMLFWPLLAVFVAVALLRCCSTRFRWLPCALMAIAMLPSPAAAQWYQHTFTDDYVYEWTWYQGHDEWLRPRCAAYPEMEYIAEHIDRHSPLGANVYAVQADYMQLYFKEHGLTLIGDQFGPERYVDFAYAIRANTVKEYASRFRVGAFLIPTSEMLVASTRGLSYDDLDRVAGELKALGYTRVVLPNAKYVVYMAPRHSRG